MTACLNWSRTNSKRNIATIAMDDGKANALSLQMLAGVNGALDQASSRRCGRCPDRPDGHFSGGFDLKVLRAGGPDAADMLEQGFLLALRLLEHPAPVVIACNGHAVAMGSFLLLSSDYRIGVDGPFRLVANEVAIGLTMPWAAIEICRQRLAPAHFNRAVILAEPYGPSRGCGGRVPRSGRRRTGLGETAAAVATSFAALDRPAHAATKAHARGPALTAIRAGLDRDQDTFRSLRAVASRRPVEVRPMAAAAAVPRGIVSCITIGDQSRSGDLRGR